MIDIDNFNDKKGDSYTKNRFSVQLMSRVEFTLKNSEEIVTIKKLLITRSKITLDSMHRLTPFVDAKSNELVRRKLFLYEGIIVLTKNLMKVPVPKIISKVPKINIF